MLDCAVKELTRDWTGGMLDLSHQAVIVPTENAGRKLREALAIHAAKREAAVLAPLILTPDAVLEWAPPGSLQAATTADSLLAWLEIQVWQAESQGDQNTAAQARRRAELAGGRR